MQQQQDIPRFDWPEILKSLAIIGLICLVYAIAVPVAGTLLGAGGSTGPVAGNDIFLWTFRGLLWALLIWRGAAIGRVVGDRIVDDMLVLSGLASIVWLVIKVIVVVTVFGAVKPDGSALPVLDVNDLLGVAGALLVSWLGAKANRY